MKKTVFYILSFFLLLCMLTGCGIKSVEGSDTETENEIKYEFIELDWSSVKLGSHLPVPPSTMGLIEGNEDYGFVLYIGNMSQAAYKDYIGKCKAYGFIENIQEGNDFFYADNAEGYHLNTDIKESVMFVRLDEPTESGEDIKLTTESEVKTEIEKFAEGNDMSVELAKSLETVLSGMKLTDKSRVGVFHYKLSDVYNWKQIEDWTEGQRYSAWMAQEHIFYFYVKKDTVVGVRDGHGNVFYTED